MLELLHEKVKLINLCCNRFKSCLAAAKDLGPSLLRGLALPQSDGLELAVEEDSELGDALDANHGVADVVSEDSLGCVISSYSELRSQNKALLFGFLKELDTLIFAQDLLNDFDLGLQLFLLLIVTV